MDQARASQAPDNFAGPGAPGFADFQILRKLGQGGMGQVYLAEQTSLKRKVALKFLRADLAANATAMSRFRAEAEAVARLNHPNIVQVYTVGEHEGLHYMALEFVDGMNLRTYLTKKGPPDLGRALLVMRRVAAALQAASEIGIVHRDIKPENILLNRKGEIKVTDFGLSRVLGDEQSIALTQSGVTMGTPLYMSPEQVQGQLVDPRSDIYSFGVTSYHLLAGQPPFSGANAFEVALKHVNAEPRPLRDLRPDLPAELIALVQRMMSKDPANRPQSGKEVIRELNVLRNQPTDATLADSPAAAVKQPPQTPTQLSLTPPAGVTALTLPWRYVGAGVLAMALGAAAHLVLPQRPVSTPAVVEPDVSEDEKFLLEFTDRLATANLSDPAKLQSALRYNAQLGALYLDQRRFAEAESFADGLTKKELPSALQFLGHLFQGVIRAYRDDPERAVASIQLAFAEKGARQYLNQLGGAGSRESVDVRWLLWSALERIDKARPLPPDMARLKADMAGSLRGRGSQPGKKGIAGPTT